MLFEKTSHIDWLAKVKKELKTEDLSSKFVEIDDNITIDPFFERISSSEKIAFRQEKSWKIVAQFRADQECNSEILQSLEGGVNYLQINKAESISDPETFFKNIFLQYVSLDLRFSTKASLDDIKKIIDFLKNYQSETALVVCCYSETKLDTKSIIPTQWNASLYEITGEDLTAQLSRIFQSIIEELDKISDSKERSIVASRIAISRIISPHIVKELAINSALLKLQHQVSVGFNQKLAAMKTIAYCYTNQELALENRYIDQAFKGLTACISGNDAVFIEASSTDNKAFHDRISRNIHHLLQEESFAHKSSEAFAGSFQVEMIAEKIVKEVWKSIKK